MKIILTESQRNLLIEGLSSVLYHKTSVSNLLSILENNEFRLTSIFDNELDKLHKQFFFLSTARSKKSHFFNIIAQGIVFLELDGELLSRKYKGKSVDYFLVGNEKAPSDYYSEFYRKQYVKNIESKEMEDRIISDKNIIPNAISYIKEISVFVNKDEISQRWSSNIRKIALILKRYNVPLFFYDDANAMKQSNKKKALTLTDVLSHIKLNAPLKKTTNINYYFLNALYYMIRAYYNNPDERTLNWMRQLLNASKNKETFEQFKKNTRTDFRIVLSNYPNRFLLHILKIFRKEKIDNIDDYLDILIKKWRETLQK